MTNAHNTQKKSSRRSAATNPKPPAVTATTARKAASRKKGGNRVSNKNYPQGPSDDPNADANHDEAGEPLPDRQNSRHRNDVGIQELTEKYTEMQAALKKAEADNAKLQERLDDAKAVGEVGAANDEDNAMIPRPPGTAGSAWSVQVEMGLQGKGKKYDMYKAIQRSVRDLVHNARLNWEVSWREIPARDKATLYEVARDKHPYLQRFANDWATEELVKQYLKNRRGNHYANGWLDVPAKYDYLKGNSQKRNPTGSRRKKALSAVAAAQTKARKRSVTQVRRSTRKTRKTIADDEDEEGGGDENAMDIESEGDQDSVDA